MTIIFFIFALNEIIDLFICCSFAKVFRFPFTKLLLDTPSLKTVVAFELKSPENALSFALLRPVQNNQQKLLWLVSKKNTTLIHFVILTFCQRSQTNLIPCIFTLPLNIMMPWGRWPHILQEVGLIPATLNNLHLRI